MTFSCNRRDRIRTCVLRSASVGPNRGPLDLVGPLRPDTFGSSEAAGSFLIYRITEKNRLEGDSFLLSA